MRLCALLLLGCGTVSGGGGPAEDCFDGVDDNDDGLVDCADPSCATGAVCAPLPPGGFAAGVMIPMAEPCPEGFTGGEMVYYRDVRDTGCVGCSCAPGATTCQAELWYYATEAECSADPTQTGGIYYGVVTEICPTSPICGYGGSRARIAPVAETCTTSGTPVPAGVGWQRVEKFCRASQQGGGCGAEQVCVPRADPADQCAAASGAHACTGYVSTEDWYTDADDQRTCAPCSCTASGGGCEDVRVEVGSDYLCTDQRALLADGQQSCLGVYCPPVRTLGAPTAPTACEVSSPTAGGTLTPTGETTVCCRPEG